MRIAIIGDGGWGTAIGLLLNSYGHTVTMWGPFADYIEELRKNRVNTRFLPGVELPSEIAFTADRVEAVERAEVVVLATPSHYFQEICSRFSGLITPGMTVVSLTKGFSEAHCRMSVVAKETLHVPHVVVISGPSHAEEVSRRIPTAVVAACEDEALARRVQALFMGPRFRVYTSPDPLGVEIGGAVKNVIAIAVGASDGLGFGDNTRAALITRGLSEITRLAVAMGANAETLSGLSGIGDLIVTCTSRHSRNHSVGERLGRGESIGSILESMKMVAEGVWNAKTVYELAQKYSVSMPITEVVYRMCYEGLSAADSVMLLMERDSRSE